MTPMNITKSGSVRIGGIRANIAEKINVSNIKVPEQISQKSGISQGTISGKRISKSNIVMKHPVIKISVGEEDAMKSWNRRSALKIQSSSGEDQD